MMPYIRMTLSDDILLFIKAASTPSDRPTMPMIPPPRTSQEMAGLPPPPALPGHHEKTKGAEWLAKHILNSPIIRRLEAELSPELFGELISLLHSRPSK
jgi:hypothetical protein